ncbi:putative transposase/invertase (TIGR01784 family) [Pedobacter cryoconitis]|uniref:Putative transposase/invertase (TIGR01784 family) n=1 Tax=Pedobacter cryoconitis TaxID=188932 RepID=A0A7W8ZQ44_9SPHI|nr:Rpn family recombination-promoting nuclease/putative transposase [Pedobacter cryoconitis]MBB5638111.1 putative transposase/invertase (TIGR01784 family) [Pedobacter cryoconitis]
MRQAIKYIDPLIDFAFKKIFGSDPNKDLLIDFLNEVFRGRKHIIDLIYNKNEHPGDLMNEGGVVFDLLCTGAHDEHFIIEVQRGKQKNFKQRALFYTSRLISDQAPKGKRNEWRYNLTEVFLIALLEDSVAEDFQEGQYLHDICLCDRDTGKIFYDKLGYIYIELHKFVKTSDQLETDLDKWLFVLKNMSSMDKIPAYLRKPVFEKLFNIAQFTNLTKEEKMLWNNNDKHRWDNKNVMDYAIELAVEEATEKVRDEVTKQVTKEITKEITKEVTKNVTEKVKKEVTEKVKKERGEEVIRIVAFKMKKDGYTAQQIVDITSLSLSEVEEL